MVTEGGTRLYWMAMDTLRRVGKNIEDHPPVDTHVGWEGRFRKAVELLNSAIDDLSFTETNMAAAPWRDAARANAERARGFIQKAMRDSWWR